MTNATDYLTRQIQQNEVIWIDTCTMMYIQRFELFINKVRPLLLKSNKQICIPDCVMAELAKHQLSEDCYKANCANEALKLIKNNYEIFKVEPLSNDASNGENFADPKILTVILEKRRNVPQLLISNDQRLTSDAYKFNNFESFYGSRVSVCYIGTNGDMNICDCAKAKPINREQEKIVYKDRVIEKETIKKVPTEKTIIEAYGLPIGISIGGIGTYVLCNWNKITKFVKNFI